MMQKRPDDGTGQSEFVVPVGVALLVSLLSIATAVAEPATEDVALAP